MSEGEMVMSDRSHYERTVRREIFERAALKSKPVEDRVESEGPSINKWIELAREKNPLHEIVII